jgi:hypothetical protein
MRELLLLALFAAPAMAQMRPVALGDRVRVVAPQAGYPRLTGTVVSTTPDVISVQVDGFPTEVPVERSQIAQLLLSIDSHRNTIRGAFLGGVLGAGITLWFGGKSSPPAAPTIDAGNVSATKMIAGTATGIALGALFGFAKKSDTWVEVPARAP